MRRFIAGAVCPQCRAMDRIVVESTEQGRQRRCVHCGHTEAQVDAIAPEPATRLAKRATAATPVQPVKFLDAAARRRPDSEDSTSD